MVLYSGNSDFFAKSINLGNDRRMDVLDLKLLETFIVLAQTRSFRATAMRLNTTQPAISNRLKRLERSLGVQLMERTKRNCQLTTRGRSLLSYSERLFSIATELRTNVAEAGAYSGILKIGVVESIAQTWLPDLVVEVKRCLPQLELLIDVDLSQALTRKLQAREIDIACMVMPGTMPGIVTEPLSVLDMVWVARVDLDIVDEPLTPEQLREYPLILHTGSWHAAVVGAWLRGTKGIPQHVLRCNNLAAITKLTMAGMGMSLVPISAVAGALRSGELRVIRTRDPMPPNPFFLAYPETHTDFAVRAMIGVIKDVVTAHTRAIATVPPPRVVNGKTKARRKS
jgi:DNA-binding transcriptional LysR family regulator